MRQVYSIREAARAAGLSEERIRRAILTGELVAHPVADDRQYLVRAADLRAFANLPAPEPEEAADRARCARPSFWRMAVAVGFIVATVLVIMRLPARHFPAVCVDCGAVKEAFDTRPTPCGTIPLIHVRKTHLTELIERAYPETCLHTWNSPASSPFGDPGRTLTTVVALDRAGVFTRAEEVDPTGAADLVRWSLRTPLTPERRRMMSNTAFETADEFRAWFALMRGDF